MTAKKISLLSSIAIASALLLGPGLFIPSFGSVNAATPGLAPGAGGVQVINADGYTPYAGSAVSFPAYSCAALPCTRDLQAKLDIPSATFPAYVQVFFEAVGSGWQNQVFSAAISQSMMNAPHNVDLGSVTFGQYGVYVLVFANTGMQSMSWEYFQVQPTITNGITSTTSITGTFKIVNTTILATSVRDGINTTYTVTNVARNDSFAPGVITGRITIEQVKHFNQATGNGTSFGVGTFTGTIIGKGPGECTYRISSVLTGQGTPEASSLSTHWLTECTGGLQGITETTTSIGNGVFSATVWFAAPTPAPAPYSAAPYSYAIIAALVLPLLASAFLLRRTKKSVAR